MEIQEISAFQLFNMLLITRKTYYTKRRIDNEFCKFRQAPI